ncbi:sensor histidine kinase [Paenibacillus lemnae]|uniref:Histidine kinase n=1 Tax=Paenibacillus lemnae TaxID=1330551 RepID=A0A848M9H4_PAELE|nr:histidine kinase [Paenibacillus lemnae]NMO97707.1 histidine kinase [Paenibacillus lemnae]
MNLRRVVQDRSSIFVKLVLGFLLAVVPMYGAAIYLNESASDSVRHDLTQSLHARSRLFMNTFEQEMAATQRLIHYLSQDKDIQKLSTISPAMSRSEYFQAVNRVQDQMRLLKNSNSYINSAETYIPQLQMTLRESSYNPSMPETRWGAIMEAQNSELHVWNESLQMGMVYPETMHTGQEPNFVIAVQFDINRIEDSLKQLNTKGSGASIISLNQSWVLQDTSRQGFDKALLAQMKKNDTTDFTAFDTTLRYEDIDYHVYIEESAELNLLLAVHTPMADFEGPLGKYKTIFFVLSGISLLVVILFSSWIYQRIHRPLYLLVRSFRKMDLNNLERLELNHKPSDEFRYLYEQYNAMVKRMQGLIDESYKQKIRSQRSELKQLQSQINPHFLYNSFFTLHQMAEMWDIDNILPFTKHLGEYFRFITKSGHDEVSLCAEVSHAQAYTQIQSIRFQPRITASWDAIPDGQQNRKVPLLILQPLLENAYEHGMDHIEQGGIIEIRMKLVNDHLIISVEDNGQHLTDEQLQQLQERLQFSDLTEDMTGLFNVHHRLRLKYGKDGGLSFSRGELGGLRVEMILPAEKEEHL